MMRIVTSLALLSACGGARDAVDPEAPALPTVVISEIMADNDGAWADPDALDCDEFDDWIELHNPSDLPAELGDLWLSDDGAEPFALRLPDEPLEPGGYLVVLADGDLAQGPLHAPFKLSADGEEVVLTHDDGRRLQLLEFGPQLPNTSLEAGTDGVFAVQTSPSPGAPPMPPVDDPCLQPPTGFDDHSFPCVSEIDGFMALAQARASTATVKFEILHFSEPELRHVALFDGDFYKLHDERYIFRLLNGQDFPGEDIYEPWTGSFATMDEVYEWVDTVDLAELFDEDLLRVAGKRLTSKRYYQLALNTDPRVLGVGVLIHRPATAVRGEVWGFELEYGDEIEHAELVVYFEALSLVLPPEISEGLVWLVRSPRQERLAVDMEEGALAYADRLLRYAELASPGEVEVYSPGITAGKVRMVRAGESGVENSTVEDLLVVDQIPDDLPPAAALFSSVPQTPLAHVALLAESRGIPNAYVAGITADPAWDQWARVRAFVAVRASLDGGFEFEGISGFHYARWRDLREPVHPELVPVDVTGLAFTADPSELSAFDMPALRAEVGGKAAGFLPLLDAGVPVPGVPLFITVRASVETLALLDWLPSLVETAVFRDGDESRGRYLVLEGPQAYVARHDDPGDRAYRSAFLEEHPEGTMLGDLARVGVKAAIAALEVPSEVLQPIEAALVSHFADLAPEQGLRFRSSSNVEDLEGFNGAGLYVSATGFLDPSAALAPADRDRTVSAAMLEVWASYWGAEAFEERAGAGIDHLAGAMGLVVHPRFDDAWESANGVVTTRIERDGRWTMTVNAQAGAVSVVSPPSSDSCLPVLPEVVRVSDGVIERIQSSTLQLSPVLSDPELLALYDDTRAVAELWLEVENGLLPEAQHRSSLTLDLELRRMEAAWPARRDGTTSQRRVLLKQARSLESGVASLPEEAQQAAFPRDLLSRAREVGRVTCTADVFELEVMRLTTDPLRLPEFAVEPFLGEVEVRVLEDVAELGWLAGEVFVVDHTRMAAEVMPGGVGFVVSADAGVAGLGGMDLAVEADASWSFGGVGGVVGDCEVDVVYASADGYLEGLLDE